MENEENPSSDNILNDFNFLSRLVVGIGEVSEIAGVPRRKLRYWEEKGIIHSIGETNSNTRRYDYLNIKKILLIQELVEEGYTLDAAAQKVEKRMQKMNQVFKKLQNTKSTD